MSVKRFRLLMAALFGVILALAAATTIGTVFVVGPTLETKLYPVVSKLHIDRMEMVDENHTRIYASFTKLRGCNPLGMAWYRGKQNQSFERVSYSVMRAPDDLSSPIRPLGFQHAGPWEVAIPMGEVANNSFVEIFHDCHWGWVTTTEFYP